MTDEMINGVNVSGVKTDCPHFSTVGNLCSRVMDGMVRCDEYPECEFKYINVLKEENKRLKEEINKLATVLEEIYTIAGDTRAELSNRNAHTRGNLRWIMDKIKAVR